MPTQEPDIAESVATDLDVLNHPDPDPDLLPVLSSAHELALQEQTASHLLRATIKAEASIAYLKSKMDADMAAWASEIAKAQARTESWRAIVRRWMIRNGITQLKSPWFTASIGKGRSKIVVDDEQPCIEILEAKFEGRAVKVRKSVDKKEFDALWNATPSTFEKVAHEEIGEQTLIVRKK